MNTFERGTGVQSTNTPMRSLRRGNQHTPHDTRHTHTTTRQDTLAHADDPDALLAALLAPPPPLLPELDGAGAGAGAGAAAATPPACAVSAATDTGAGATADAAAAGAAAAGAEDAAAAAAGGPRAAATAAACWALTCVACAKGGGASALEPVSSPFFPRRVPSMTSFRMDCGGGRNPALCPKSAGEGGVRMRDEQVVVGNCCKTSGRNARVREGAGGAV